MNYERDLATTSRDNLKKHLAEARKRVAALDGAYEAGGSCQPHLLVGLREARLTVARLEQALTAANDTVQRLIPADERHYNDTISPSGVWSSGRHQRGDHG